MGLELKFLPIEGELGQDRCFSHMILGINRAIALTDAIAELPAKELDRDFHSFCGEPPEEISEQCNGACYGNRREDSYGVPLTYVRAKDLKTLKDHEWVISSGWQNRAVWAFIEELPDDMKVVLLWD